MASPKRWKCTTSLARRNLIKKIEQSSNETYSVTVEDILALRHIIAEGCMLCKMLLSKTGDVNKAVELYNKVCYENSIQDI